MTIKQICCAALVAAFIGTSSASGDHGSGLVAEKGNASPAAFDIVRTRITTQGNTAVFLMALSDKAGQSKPAVTGKLAGSDVFSYVWPTTIDTYAVGFEGKAGILALAVTAHPDFDDTPLFDENGDGDTRNDGNIWHSHWVVLESNERCGKGALGVVDIAEGTRPRLPKTWPGLPILLDSPGWQPVFKGNSVEVMVAFDDISAVEKGMFDGVTAGLRVNESAHAPLLCVVNVMDVASGDLSLPGKVNQ